MVGNALLQYNEVTMVGQSPLNLVQFIYKFSSIYYNYFVSEKNDFPVIVERG